MVLVVLLSSALFVIELRVHVGSSQEDIGLEQLVMGFPKKLLLQTELDLELDVPFKFIKLDLGFISSLDPEFPQEDVPLRTFSGFRLSNEKSWLSPIHFLFTKSLPLDLETEEGSFGEDGPFKS